MDALAGCAEVGSWRIYPLGHAYSVTGGGGGGGESANILKNLEKHGEKSAKQEQRTHHFLNPVQKYTKIPAKQHNS